jgi:hypothetical protein
MPEEFKTGFLRVLWILRDYLSVIVIGGGWVPLLYYHYLLREKSKTLIRTRDIDLLVHSKVPIIGGKRIDLLLQEAGLKSTFRSLDTPAVIHYEGTIGGEEVEIEFLTDQQGAKDDPVIEVQEGRHAEALRFVSIPITHTVDVTIDDFCYIFDLLANCPALGEPIREGLIGFEKKYPPWFSRFTKNLRSYFSDPAAKGVLMISNQRPEGAFPELTKEQFNQYVFGAFQELMHELAATGDSPKESAIK